VTGALRRLGSGLGHAETGLVVLALAAMAVLPILEIVLRRTVRVGVPGSILIVQHLTLLIAFLGAALAAREGKLLALSTGSFVPERLRDRLRVLGHAAGAGVSAWLTVAALEFVRSEQQAGRILTLGVPLWAVLAVMPLCFAAIALRLAWTASPHTLGRALAAAGLALPALIAALPGLEGRALLAPGLVVLALATLAGLPIFAALGGAALLLFQADGAPVASVPIDAYSLTSMPILPAVPLFTLSGYVLGAGRASDRLVRVFTALVGWLPGGAAVVTTLVFAFFTSFTGASGVTILTLGGLLLPVLLKSRYSEGFSIGLVTVSGSIGLLLPPSLPVILYAVNARVPADELLIGGIVPGIVFVLLVALWGVREGRRSGAARTSFRAAEARRAVWAAKWDLAVPVVVLVALFGGFATMVEAAALTVLYAAFVQCVVHRDVRPVRDLPRVFGECASLVGGFLIILAVAQGLTNYLSFAEVPTRALAFVQAHVESPLVFLLVLNVFLLIVGALMDIYSAIFVVVPLIVPIAAAYGIHPVHLGIVFLANLELGYLTPPMGENLFLSAYRFEMPVMRVFRYSLPFYVVIAVGVLVITYLPALTLWPLRLLGR